MNLRSTPASLPIGTYERKVTLCFIVGDVVSKFNLPFAPHIPSTCIAEICIKSNPKYNNANLKL